MSNSGNAVASKRALTSAIILIAVLAIFSAIVILQSSLLQWPLPSEIRNAREHLGQNNSNSSLLISAISHAPISLTFEDNGSIVSPGNLVSPIAGANITIYTTYTAIGNPVFVNSSNTDAMGQQLFKMHPGIYKVFMTSNLGNATAVVTTSPGNTTELDIEINENSYACSFFQISNSASSNLLAPWDSIFLKVDTTSSIVQNANESVFLRFVSNLKVVLNPKLDINILTEYSSPADGTLWMQIQLKSVANITGITAINLLTYLTSYSTKEYLLNQTEFVYVQNLTG